MPTEQEIESACVAFVAQSNEDSGDNATWPDDFDQSGREAIRRVTSAALTAAEKVRGQVSEEDECIIREYEEYASGWTKTLKERNEPIPHDVLSIGRLCALARRGAGRAVPDEAAIRADERERCAKVMDAAAMAAFARAEDEGSSGDYAGASEEIYYAVRARNFEFAAKAIRAAAPKPEDKP